MGGDDPETEQPEQLLSEVTFEGIVKYMLSDKCKEVFILS